MGSDPDWEAYQEDLGDEMALRDEMETPEPPDPPETPEERAHAEWVAQVEREIDATEEPF